MVAYPEMTVQVKKYGRKFFPLLSDISTSEQKKELELSGVGRRYRAANTSRISANKPLKTLRELVTVAMVSRQEWRDADKSKIAMIETCEEGAARAGSCWLALSYVLESGVKSEKYPRLLLPQIKTQTATATARGYLRLHQKV
eukprot:scaffold5994_cov150-Skeletonema_dohrnii-CCMP3373.AAC.3